MFGFEVYRETGETQITDKGFPLTLKRSFSVSIQLTAYGSGYAIGGALTDYIRIPGDFIFIEPPDGVSVGVWNETPIVSGMGENLYLTASAASGGLVICNVFIFSMDSVRGVGPEKFGMEVSDASGKVTFSNRDYVAGISKSFMPLDEPEGDLPAGRVAFANCFNVRNVQWWGSMDNETWVQGVRFTGNRYSIRVIGNANYSHITQTFDNAIPNNQLSRATQIPVLFVDVTGKPVPYEQTY